MNKQIITIIIGIILLGLIAWGGYELFKPVKEPIVCAEEGEMISIMPTPTGELGMECCEEFNSGVSYTIIDGECNPEMDVAICIDCPNDECGPGENKCNCPEDCEGKTANWKTYQNTKYGYEIKYPTDWKTQGGNDLYEIRNGGAFVQIGMVERNVNISLGDWFKKQHDYYLNIPDGNPIYAEPYNPDKITDYNFNGIFSKKTKPISYDYSGISFYFKKGTDILCATYTDANSNDKNFGQKIPILNQILSTFKFID